jgi:hypothetical protein
LPQTAPRQDLFYLPVLRFLKRHFYLFKIYREFHRCVFCKFITNCFLSPWNLILINNRS